MQIEPRWQRRAALPPPQQPTPTDINVWALVKDFVGKGELSKMATPVQFLEPLSELQQRCEDLEYSELLDQARLPSSTISRLHSPLLARALVLTSLIDQQGTHILHMCSHEPSSPADIQPLYLASPAHRMSHGMRTTHQLRCIDLGPAS